MRRTSKILVAACRAGWPCRYHGRKVESPRLMEKLRGLEYKLLCPEMAAGLGVPRLAIRVRTGRYFIGGREITKPLTETCERLAASAQRAGCKYFVGVIGSPCCDPRRGLFVQTLRKFGITTYLSVKS